MREQSAERADLPRAMPMPPLAWPTLGGPARHQDNVGMTYAESQQHEFNRCLLASQSVDELLHAWNDLKTVDKWQKSMTATNDQYVALTVLVARQIRFLEGCRAAALAGSPEPTDVLARSMFETWLAVLAISFGARDTVSKPERNWLPNELGSRFLAHGKFLLGQKLEAERAAMLRLAFERGVPRKEALKALREARASCQVPPGTFPRKQATWHPFKRSKPGDRESLEGLALALWPKGRGPVFPKRLFSSGRRLWCAQLPLYWAVPSEATHTTGLVVSEYLRPAPDGLVHDERRFEAHGLVKAVRFAGQSIQAVSIVVGMETEWDVTSRRAYKTLAKVEDSSFPYLAITDPTLRRD